MFSLRTTPKKFENTTITGGRNTWLYPWRFALTTWLLWNHHFCRKSTVLNNTSQLAKTQCRRFQIPSVLRALSKSSVFDGRYLRVSVDSRGAFHSIKNSDNCWISENRTIQPKWSQMEPKFALSCPLYRKFRKKCCSIRHWKFPEIQTGIFHRMTGAQGVTSNASSWFNTFHMIMGLIHKFVFM